MSAHRLHNVPIPKHEGDKIYWQYTPGCARALALVDAAKQSDGPFVVITPDTHVAHQLERELKLFARDENLSVSVFPDWETLPYDSFSPHQDIISERLSTLLKLPSANRGFTLVPLTTLMHKLLPKSHLLGSSFVMKVGDTLDIQKTTEQLLDACYRKVDEVGEHGEFAVRGAIMDIFPMGAHEPIRIELFDDEVETLRTFDPDTQRSLEKTESIQILPAREFSLDETSIKAFRKRWREIFEGNPKACTVYEDISNHIVPSGIEYFLPLFYESLSTLFDYCPKSSTLVLMNVHLEHVQNFWQSIQDRYEQYRHDRLRPILTPKALFVDPDSLFAQLKPFKQIHLVDTLKDKANYFDFNLRKMPDLSINHKLSNPLQALAEYVEQRDSRVLICAESAGRLQALKELLSQHAIKPTVVEHIKDFLKGQQALGLTIAPIDLGFDAPDENLTIIAEAQLYGTQVMQRRRRRKTQVVESDYQIRNIAELKIGEPIVHLDFGVGRYLGLQHLNAGGVNTEYVQIQYAGSDKLYVPVSSLHLISKFSGPSADAAPLNKLGSDHWDKAKHKALKKANDVAAELLEIYAKRQAKKGFRFNIDDNHYLAFSAQFPFEETPDQLKAIEEVLQDMHAPQPMDRLVCGDVGFGKTEVAMRAAFIAVQNGKQVAVLVPTTLLAQQHFETFSDRFADWPVNIAALSRFKSKKEQDEIIEKVKQGKIDILIGTHKIIQQDIHFNKLGLVIIDEEHRFGVKQKEQLKKLRADVDILTLTATPIPRTLNLAFAHLRDLSIIATPPQKRLSIKTFVREHQKPLIKEAIMRELMRGGQVYYLHNSVDTIDKTARDIAELVPQGRIGVAHGQMRERELEGVMADFYHQRFNILVCTTIIETGIDVPSANTIIIDRADKLGLAQLHQLRGRVGRSHHQAYAYCLTPNRKRLTPDSIKRLEALESLEELGSGFILASHDLEIRGAGELLGQEQSGDMHTIGFSLYMEILDKAVRALKRGEPLSMDDPLQAGTEIDLNLPALIPESYIRDVNTRLLLYKRISHAKSKADLDELQVEMIDRFGLLPTEVKHLFRLTQLKLTTTDFGIKIIKANANGGHMMFVKEPNINPTAIIEMIRTQPSMFQLKGSERLNFKIEMPEAEERFKIVEQMISKLSPQRETTQ